jgi:hypothetical protein
MPQPPSAQQPSSVAYGGTGGRQPQQPQPVQPQPVQPQPSRAQQQALRGRQVSTTSSILEMGVARGEEEEEEDEALMLQSGSEAGDGEDGLLEEDVAGAAADDF